MNLRFGRLGARQRRRTGPAGPSIGAPYGEGFVCRGGGGRVRDAIYCSLAAAERALAT